MGAPAGMVPVNHRFFGVAVSRLQETGQISVTKSGFGGASVRCALTQKEVARQYAGEYGGVTTYVLTEFFSHITVNGSRYRELTGSEYEMICRKLEAHAVGDKVGADSYVLPPWTIGIYEKAVADGRKSLRGRTSLVAMPFTMTFEQAVMGSEQEESTPAPRPRMA